MPSFDQSNNPFPEMDSKHGPSRDAIIVYLRELRNGFREISSDLKEHKEKTSSALEVIRMSIHTMPKICPRADECGKMWDEVDILRLEKAEQKGAILGGKIVFGCVSGIVSAAFTLAVAYFTLKK